MTSTWPWMKDVAVPLVETPIEPLDEYDKRPAIKDLIEEHRSTIDKVRAGLADDPLFNAAKHDDLWLLRFVLSNKKSKASIEAAAKECLIFRDKFKLDEKDVRATPPPKTEGSPVMKYVGACDDDAIVYTVPRPQGGVLLFLYFGRFNQPRILEELSKEDLLGNYVHGCEWTFQNIDYVTRTTGRLTKTIRIADMDGFSSKRMSMELNRKEGEVIGQMDHCYPQLLDTCFVTHALAWMQVPWRVLRPLMPKRVVSKIDFVNVKDNPKERKRLFKVIPEEKLPIKYGGKNEVQPQYW